MAGQLLKEGNCLRILSRHGPDELAESNLAEDIVTCGKLPDSYIADGKLSQGEDQADSELRNDRQAQNELAETKQQTDPELSDGYQTDAELPDGDNAPGNHKPAVLSPDGHMDQRPGADGSLGLPFYAPIRLAIRRWAGCQWRTALRATDRSPAYRMPAIRASA